MLTFERIAKYLAAAELTLTVHPFLDASEPTWVVWLHFSHAPEQGVFVGRGETLEEAICAASHAYDPNDSLWPASVPS
jgi:hypothetical protein